jgi:hypothetical protein
MQVKSSVWFATYCTGIHGYDCLALLNLKHEKDLQELVLKLYVVYTVHRFQDICQKIVPTIHIM